MSILATPAILLRSYPFSETSQILKFYTESRGLLSTVARGVRKAGGRRGGSLSTFTEGILNAQFRDSRDLQTFRDFSPTKYRRGLAADPLRLASASVLGELILKHAEGDGSQNLYAMLGLGLDTVETVPRGGLIPSLLTNLWSLIREMGFGPMVGHCVACGKPFLGDDIGRFDFAAGGLRCEECLENAQGPRLGPGARDQLEAMLEGDDPGDLGRPMAHLRLASDFITYHISGGNPLKSMTVLATLAPDEDA